MVRKTKQNKTMKAKVIKSEVEDYKDKVILISGIFVFSMMFLSFVVESSILTILITLLIVGSDIYCVVAGIKLLKLKYRLAPYILTVYGIYLLYFILSFLYLSTIG